MSDTVRVTVEKINEQGKVVSKVVVIEKEISKPEEIIDIGFRHSEQIDILKSIQDEYISQQSIYFKEDLDACPRCGGKLCKHGYTKSDFHAVFTDHKIPTSRQVCNDCQWRSIPSIKSLFWTNIHPDLGKMQSEFGARYSYRDAQSILNKMSHYVRKVNHHNGIKQITQLVGKHIDEHPDEIPCDVKPSEELIVQVDGGHVKTIEDQRSIEAMTSVVYDAKNIEYKGGRVKDNGDVTEIRGIITSKSCAASALSDNQKSIRAQTLVAAKLQGLTKQTRLTAICDGAANCWSVIDSLSDECQSIERILDWFHLSMKFKNSGLGNKKLNDKLDGAKWYLWHGQVEDAISRLEELRQEVTKDTKKANKLEKLLSYVVNNKNCIVNYDERKNKDLVFTSQMAESNVESLINQRCKGQQHMKWSRDGLHNILTLRAAMNTYTWSKIWEKHVIFGLKKAA
jgi:hypothetical protein